MRIALVKNVMLEYLREIIASVPGYKIAWEARTGNDAVKKCGLDMPDLLLIDPNIPGLDGVEAVRRIMAATPCPILLVTATVEGNAAKVFEAMRYGALDAVNTPVPGTDTHAQRSKEVLLRKVRNIVKLKGLESDAPPAVSDNLLSDTSKYRPPSEHFSMGISRKPPLKKVPPLIVIGSSTGGPKTLAKILASLPSHFEGAIVIVQHLEQEFCAGLADWLNSQSSLAVQLALEGKSPEAGKVYVAGSNDHLVISPQLTFSYTPEPRENPYRPSVDVLFMSVAKHWPEKGCAVLLTGMGRDGAAGLASLRQLGWHTIAQDKATSIVYGMPKAAKELNAAIDILPVEEIGHALLDFLTKSHKPRDVTPV